MSNENETMELETMEQPEEVCEVTTEEVEKKIDEEKDVEGLVITIVAGKATAAAYKKISTVKDAK